MRLSDRSAMTEARRFKTLTLGRAVGGGAGGVAMPQATVQNQIIIADAALVWTLLAAPAAEGQVPITGADPSTPAWGTVFPAEVQFLANVGYGSISDPEYSIHTDGVVMVERDAWGEYGYSSRVVGDDHFRFYVYASGRMHWGSGSALPDVKLYRSAADTLRLEDTFVVDAGITLNGATGANIITVPDDAAQAMHVVDVGGIEYLRIITTDAQPAVVFNEGGADVDFRIETFGNPDAVHLVGSTGNFGLGAAPGARSFKLYRTGEDAVFEVESATDDAMLYLDAPADERCLVRFQSAGATRFQFSRLASSDDLELYSHADGIGVVMNWEYATGYTDAKYLLKLQAGLTLYGATGVNVVTVPDNVAQAIHLVDVGGIEYLRIISTDAQPAVVFNEGGADVDYRVEASGQVNALFVQGDTGNIGAKTNDPATDWHVVGGAVANKHHTHSTYRTQILEDDNVVLQLIGVDSTTAMAHLVLTAAPDSGDNKHWIVSHLGPVASNRFSIGYKTSSTDGFTPYDPTEFFTISTAGAVHIVEDSASVRLSGTTAIQLGIGEPIVETFGQFRIPWACTVTRVDGNVIGGTSCTVNIEERGTLGSAGTNVLSSDMVADADGESVTSSFNNSSLAVGNHLAIDVSAVSGAVDCLSITLTVTID